MAGNRPIEKRLMQISDDIEGIREEMRQMNGNNNPISLEMDTCPNTKMAMQEVENEE